MKSHHLKALSIFVIVTIVAFAGCSQSMTTEAVTEPVIQEKTPLTIIRETLASVAALSDKASGVQCPQPPSMVLGDPLAIDFYADKDRFNTLVLSSNDVAKLNEVVEGQWKADWTIRDQFAEISSGSAATDQNLFLDGAIEVARDDNGMYEPAFELADMKQMLQQIKYVAFFQNYRIKTEPTAKKHFSVIGLLGTPGQKAFNNVPDIDFTPGTAEADVIVFNRESGELIGAFVVQGENPDRILFTEAKDDQKLTHDEQYVQQLKDNLHRQTLAAVAPLSVEYFASSEEGTR